VGTRFTLAKSFAGDWLDEFGLFANLAKHADHYVRFDVRPQSVDHGVKKDAPHEDCYHNYGAVCDGARFPAEAGRRSVSACDFRLAQVHKR